MTFAWSKRFDRSLSLTDDEDSAHVTSIAIRGASDPYDDGSPLVHGVVGHILVVDHEQLDREDVHDLVFRAATAEYLTGPRRLAYEICDGRLVVIAALTTDHIGLLRSALHREAGVSARVSVLSPLGNMPHVADLDSWTVLEIGDF